MWQRLSCQHTLSHIKRLKKKTENDETDTITCGCSALATATRRAATPCTTTPQYMARGCTASPLTSRAAASPPDKHSNEASAACFSLFTTKPTKTHQKKRWRRRGKGESGGGSLRTKSVKRTGTPHNTTPGRPTTAGAEAAAAAALHTRFEKVNSKLHFFVFVRPERRTDSFYVIILFKWKFIFELPAKTAHRTGKT